MIAPTCTRALTLGLLVLCVGVPAILVQPVHGAPPTKRCETYKEECQVYAECLAECGRAARKRHGLPPYVPGDGLKLPPSEYDDGSELDECERQCEDEHFAQVDAYYESGVDSFPVDAQVSKIKGDTEAMKADMADGDDDAESGANAGAQAAVEGTSSTSSAPRALLHFGRRLLQAARIQGFTSFIDALRLLRNDNSAPFDAQDFRQARAAVREFGDNVNFIVTQTNKDSLTENNVRNTGSSVRTVEGLTLRVDDLDESQSLFGEVGNIAIDNIQSVFRQLQEFIDTYVGKRFVGNNNRNRSRDYSNFKRNLQTARDDLDNLNRLRRPAADNNRIVPVVSG